MDNFPFIILVQPQLAENIGMTARAMMNCGLYNLRLVSPRQDHLSPKAVAASSGAEEILEQARIFNTTEEAIADLEQVYATTSRHRDQIKFVYTAEQAMQNFDTLCRQNTKCGILFGPERTGLQNDDISLADAIINIPLNPRHCSLNLSQAVLLVGYEFFKRQTDIPGTRFVTNGAEIAPKEKLFQFFSYLEKELDDCGNFKVDEKRPRMVRNLRNIFSRPQLTGQELDTLYGVINYLRRPHKN